MVVSTAKQLNSTYQLWQRFTFPSEEDPRDAIAVPKSVGDQLNAAYALIIDLALVHFWSILFGLILYFYIRGRKTEVSKFNPLAPIIWNKRADLFDAIIETLTSLEEKWKSPGIPLLLLLTFAAWVGQKATGILVPPLIIIGNAAPVNPEASKQLPESIFTLSIVVY